MLCPQCGILLPDNVASCGQCGIRFAAGKDGDTRSRQASPAPASDSTIFEPLPRVSKTPQPGQAAPSHVPQARAAATVPYGWLVAVAGPDAGADFRLDNPGRYAIGTAKGSSMLSLTDPAVASLHVLATVDAEGVKVRDLDTPVGAVLRGAPLTGAALMAEGDVLEIGKTRLTLKVFP
jgi:hypothetical protein